MTSSRFRPAMRAILMIVLCMFPAMARADYQAGKGAYERGEYRSALAELVPAAETDARAALLLADMFARGRGVERDAQQALMWQRRAGDLGDVQAQLALGERYLKGTGVPAQPREAALWFERAAQQGSAQARFELGRMLAEGNGIPPDAAEGRRLIELAAAEGSTPARQWLGQSPGGQDKGTVVAKAPRPTPPPESYGRNPVPGDVRLGPQIGFGWSTYQNWGNGTWSGLRWWDGPYGLGPAPWGWYPYGWYPYGYPGSAAQFGFGFAN